MKYTVRTCLAAALDNIVGGGASATNIAAANQQRGMIPATTLLLSRAANLRFIDDRTIYYTLSAINKTCGVMQGQESVCTDPSNISQTIVKGELNGLAFPFSVKIKKDSVFCEENGNLSPVQEFVQTVEQKFLEAYQGIESWTTEKIAGLAQEKLPDGRTTEQPVFFRSSVNQKIEFNDELAMWIGQGISGTSLMTRNSVIVATNKAAMAANYQGGTYYAITPRKATPTSFVLNQNQFCDSVYGDGKTNVFQVYDGAMYVVSYSPQAPQATPISSVAQLDTILSQVLSNGINGVKKYSFFDNIGLFWVVEVSKEELKCDEILGKQEFYTFSFHTRIDAIVPALAMPSECGVSGVPIYRYFDGYVDGLAPNTGTAPSPMKAICVDRTVDATCANFTTFELIDPNNTQVITSASSVTAQNPNTQGGLSNILNLLAQSVVWAVGREPYFRLENGLVRYYDNGSNFLGAANDYIIRETGACGGEILFSTLNCEDIVN